MGKKCSKLNLNYFKFAFRDGQLSLDEFTLICRALFRNDKGHIYDVPKDRLHLMFEAFDTNNDGYIDREEFKFCWNNWIKTVSIKNIYY